MQRAAAAEAARDRDEQDVEAIVKPATPMIAICTTSPPPIHRSAGACSASSGGGPMSRQPPVSAWRSSSNPIASSATPIRSGVKRGPTAE